MANNPTVLYNFNENSTTTIRDYSQSGYNGAGSNLTVSASSRVGYDAVFDGTLSQVTNSTNTAAVGAFKLGYFLAINLTSNTGTDTLLYHNNIMQVTWDGTTLTAILTTTSGTYSVTNDITSLSTATWYDVTISITPDPSNDLVMIIDGVPQTVTAVLGTVDITNQYFNLGSANGVNKAAFKLNEFKIFDDSITTLNDSAFRNEQNGVLMNTALTHDFALGDIIGADIISGEIKTGIVTYIEASTVFRIQPITDNITSGMIFNRVGHLWDSTRQWRFVIDDTPSICFYDGISLTDEIFSTSKKVYCLTKEGIIDSSTDVTTTYTVLSTDQIIYVDSSGGAFTITLESAPTTNRQFTIIDKAGNLTANNVTINGNGNNINGSSTAIMTSNYQAWNLIYNGTQWNLK